MLKRFLLASRQNKVLTILVLVGSLSWSLTMFKSGLIYSFGMGFWGPNGHDGIWHISLIESLSQGSLEMPVFAGESIKNYHIGFDLLLAILHKITKIPINILYFQIIPTILAVSIGILTYKFVLFWRKSESEALWSTFFVYFGGSLGWVFGKGESAFWSQQAISTLINPPFALSLVFILLGLISLVKFKKIFLPILFFGLLIQIKAYAGVLVLASLFTASIFSRKLFLIFLGSSIISLVLFLPFNKNSQNLLVFQPFWFLETMMGFSDRFYWPKFYSAMTNYVLVRNWVKGVPAYLMAFAIFWIGNLGTRVIKELSVISYLPVRQAGLVNWKRLNYIEVFIVSMIVLGLILPMLFIQKGTPWNTIQFLYYSLFFSGILAGISISELIKRIHVTALRYTVAGLVIFLTIPTTIGTLWNHYLPGRPPAKISNEELEALEFLKKQPNGVVLTYPFDRDAAKEAENNPPRPLYLYESTAYVSAFSKKPVYLEDEVNLDITGHDWISRREKTLDFFNSLNPDEARKFLDENSIEYIYIVKSEIKVVDEKHPGIKKIFENDVINIFRATI